MVITVWFGMLVVSLVPLLTAWHLNDLMGRRARITGDWTQLQEELKRRHELIRRLVPAARGCDGDANAALRALVRARMAAVIDGCSGDGTRILSAEDLVGSTLRTLFAVADTNSGLRDRVGFSGLRQQLEVIEEKLELSLGNYNTTLRDYNRAVHRFPSALIASSFGFGTVAHGGLQARRRDRPAGRIRPGVQLLS